MARTTRDDLVVCRTSFFVGNTLVRAGDVWAADDRIPRLRPSDFRKLEVHESDPEPAPRPRPVLRRPTTKKKGTASS
jgi:hypothetical protein